MCIKVPVNIDIIAINATTTKHNIKQHDLEVQYPIMKTLTSAEVPLWMLDNPNIHGGYRPPGTFNGIVNELITIHNETINAWTMVLGGIVAIYLWLTTHLSYKLAFEESFVFTLFMLSALIVIPFSVKYHCMCCISYSTKAATRRNDTISVLGASFLLAIALSWFVFPFYITIILGCSSLYIILQACRLYSGENNNKQLIAQTLGAGVFLYLLPVMYMAIIKPYQYNMYLVRILGSLCIGGVLYVTCVPEIWIPNVFDFVGNSHQLMHILLILAHYFEYQFLKSLTIDKNL